MTKGSPDFQVKFSAKDDGTFGGTIRKVKKDLSDITTQLASSVSGGLIGGGAVGTIMTVVDKVARLVSDTIRLAEAGRKISVPFQRIRGISNAAEAMGANPDSVFSAIGSLDQQRADALAGDPEAIRSFERLGIALKDIAGLKPDELFFRVGDAFRGELTPQRMISARQMLGGEDLLPFLVRSGGQVFRPNQQEESAMQFIFTKLASGALRAYESFNNGSQFAASLDPVSTYQEERRTAASKLATQNRERAIDLVRSQLSIEQQLTLAVSERLKIERDLASVQDPVRRQRMVGRLLDLDATILGARNAQAAAQVPPNSAPWARNLDDLSRAGIFTGGSPSLFIDLAKQQLIEAKKHTDLLRNTPEDLAKRI